MLIAIQNPDASFSLKEHREAFPNPSFPPSGPSLDFYAANNCFPVSLSKPCDLDTHRLVSVPPYLEDGTVFTVQVVNLSTDEMAQINATKTAKFIRSVEESAQAMLDAFARTKNYDGILSATTYAASSVPSFAADGAYAVLVRDQVWAALYALMEHIKAGIVPMPTSFEIDVKPVLPVLAWPL